MPGFDCLSTEAGVTPRSSVRLSAVTDGIVFGRRSQGEKVSGSWWQDCPREGFTARAQAQYQAVMRHSKDHLRM